MASLPEQAYEGLYERLPNKQLSVEYSGRLKHFNAQILSKPHEILFKLSKDFLEVDDEIRIGVMQHLLCKLNKRSGSPPKQTLEMDLYNGFLKNLGEYKTGSGGVIEDHELQDSFNRVNAAYFDDFMLAPNIRWSGNSRSHLGHYTFADDTVVISNALRGAGEFLDYVLYHELLHKKHKFEHRNGRTHSHTPVFRKDERKFRMANGKEPEKALHAYLRGLGRRPTVKKTKPKTIIRKLLDFF